MIKKIREMLQILTGKKIAGLELFCKILKVITITFTVVNFYVILRYFVYIWNFLASICITEFYSPLYIGFFLFLFNIIYIFVYNTFLKKYLNQSLALFCLSLMVCFLFVFSPFGLSIYFFLVFYGMIFVIFLDMGFKKPENFVLELFYPLSFIFISIFSFLDIYSLSSIGMPFAYFVFYGINNFLLYGWPSDLFLGSVVYATGSKDLSKIVKIFDQSILVPLFKTQPFSSVTFKMNSLYNVDYLKRQAKPSLFLNYNTKVQADYNNKTLHLLNEKVSFSDFMKNCSPAIMRNVFDPLSQGGLNQVQTQLVEEFTALGFKHAETGACIIISEGIEGYTRLKLLSQIREKDTQMYNFLLGAIKNSPDFGNDIEMLVKIDNTSDIIKVPELTVYNIATYKGKAEELEGLLSYMRQRPDNLPYKFIVPPKHDFGIVSLNNEVFIIERKKTFIPETLEKLRDDSAAEKEIKMLKKVNASKLLFVVDQAPSNMDINIVGQLLSEIKTPFERNNITIEVSFLDTNEHYSTHGKIK
jgi:hypothetical protein